MAINRDFNFLVFHLHLHQQIKYKMMNKIGIFYGSTTGTTEEIANRIAEKLDVSKNHIHDVGRFKKELISEYDVLLLGSSTWGDGELQDDWYDTIEIIKKEDLSHKFVGLFGCGDCKSYPDTFCDAMGILYEDLKNTRCTFCGSMETKGYDFSSSIAVVNNRFVGLPIDEGNESDQTDSRIDQWIKLVKEDIN